MGIMAVEWSDLDRLRALYQLKQVYRFNSVGDRKESVAEHTFSSLVLADFLMLRYDFKVDRQRVMDMLLYHDWVELYTGDTPLGPGFSKEGQLGREEEASERLGKELPLGLAEKYRSACGEFTDGKTREARLAEAVDKLDAELHERGYRQDWRGWTEEFLRKSKERYFVGFPELQRLFEEHIRYLRENGYFDVK